MSDPATRAELRRKTWVASVERGHPPKRGLYSEMSPGERLVALARLNAAAWAAAGVHPSDLPRERWPSEVFVLRRT